MVQRIEDMERIKHLENGEKFKPVFSKEEMENRIGKLRKYMGEQGIDAVLFTSYQNICYYSEYLYTDFGREYGLVITQDTHTTISANIDGGMPWRRSYQDNIVYTDWKRDNFYYTVQKVLNDAGVKKGVIGIEFDEVSLDLKKALDDYFDNYKFVDVGEQCMRFRMIKSQEEIDFIKDGAAVADVGGEAVFNTIKDGITEYEVALAGVEAMTHKIAELHPQIDLRDSWIWFQSGVNTDGAHNWATTRKVRPGDILSHNSFAMLHGYYTALERTMFLDWVGDDHLKYWEINVEVHEAGLELIKPGAVCSEICHELNKIFNEYGLLSKRSFGYGHSFGILSHYYGREAGLELREDIDTVLEPGMVVSMEPMIMIPEGQPGAGGYREHDILVVNYDGTIENITKFPYGPEHNIING